MVSFSPEDHLQLSPYLSYLSGALAGCAATVGSYPFDLLRTILASQGEPKVCNIFMLSRLCNFHAWFCPCCFVYKLKRTQALFRVHAFPWMSCYWHIQVVGKSMQINLLAEQCYYLFRFHLS